MTARVQSALGGLSVAVALAAGAVACRSRTTPVPPLPAASAAATSSAPTATASPSATASSEPALRPAIPRRPLGPDEAILVPEGPQGRKPFVLWLHGYGADSAALRAVLHLPALAAERDFAWSSPDGLVDSRKRRFWNAGPCCNYDDNPTDDVARLSNILAHAVEHPRIDPARIYVVGFSNGGFMAHRLACESRVPIAGFASLAGGRSSASSCSPAGPTAAIHVHGDADVIVRMAGGSVFDDPRLGAHAAVSTTMAEWSARNRCSGEKRASISLLGKPGDTAVLTYTGCAAPVQLWTLAGGGHLTVNAAPVVRRALDALLGIVSGPRSRGGT